MPGALANGSSPSLRGKALGNEGPSIYEWISDVEKLRKGAPREGGINHTTSLKK
jgi:hypothetical protein